MKKILTLQDLKDLPEHARFASGLAFNAPTDGPQEIYMTDSNIGKRMIWVAVRGEIHDWAIYAYWEEFGLEVAATMGAKVRDERSIKKLVNCDDEAFKMYRF